MCFDFIPTSSPSSFVNEMQTVDKTPGVPGMKHPRVRAKRRRPHLTCSKPFNTQRKQIARANTWKLKLHSPVLSPDPTGQLAITNPYTKHLLQASSYREHGDTLSRKEHEPLSLRVTLRRVTNPQQQGGNGGSERARHVQHVRVKIPRAMPQQQQGGNGHTTA